MLLTELILSKRGPLAKVWLSAHHERKLSKQQALGVDVEESIDAILTQETEPIALRLSGQLMLGVVRIYSRKVQYLFDDCRETREKISLAFRPGIVDLPEDLIRANKNAITISDHRADLDILDWTFAVPGGSEHASNNLYRAPIANISLPQSKEYGAYNFGRPKAPSIYGGSSSAASRHGSVNNHDDDGETSHLDSQDFEGIDLGLGLDDFGLGVPDRSMSMEFGRDAQMSEISRGGSVGFGGNAREDFGKDGEANDGFGGIDLGLGDFDVGASDLPQLEHDRARRDSSALSTPPPVSPPADISLIDVTPRTAARIGTLANARDALTSKQPVKKRLRLVQADEEIELADEDFVASSSLNNDINRFIPRDLEAERLRAMLEDGGSFLSSEKVGDEMVVYAGPFGLSEELRELFTFSSTVLRKNQHPDQTAEEEARDRANKRPRLTTEEDLEIGRRQSVAPSIGFDFGGAAGGGGDDSFGLGGQGWEGGGLEGDDGPDYRAPLGEDDLDRIALRDGHDFSTPHKRRQIGNLDDHQSHRAREASLAPSRAESIARAIQFDDAIGSDNVLSIFDSRSAAAAAQALESQSQSQSSLETPTKSVYYSEVRPSGTSAGSYSKNTGMAMGLLRRELENIEGQIREEKVLSFEKVAETATKRAASTFFFELLVLGTRDCIKLEQKFPFEDLEVRGKSKLWDEITA